MTELGKSNVLQRCRLLTDGSLVLHGLPGNGHKAERVRLECDESSQADPGPVIGEAHLACGIADGSVVVLRVIQTLHSQSSSSGFVPRYSVQATFNVRDVKPAEADWREVASMKWVAPSADVVSDTSRMLVFPVTLETLTPSRIHWYIPNLANCTSAVWRPMGTRRVYALSPFTPSICPSAPPRSPQWSA